MSLKSPMMRLLIAFTWVGVLTVESGANLYRQDEPKADDLLIRRLQVDLAIRISDNWNAIRDPQRWAIMNSKGPEKQILKSFGSLQEGIASTSRKIRHSKVEQILNTLNLPTEMMVEWTRYWDLVRKEIGQINTLFTYFDGYIRNPESQDKAILKDFATSVTGSPAFQDSSLQTMLDNLHNTTSMHAQKMLFPFLKSVLESQVEGD